MTDRATVEALLAIYAKLPAIKCRGLCADSCSATVFEGGGMSAAEFSRATMGMPLPRRRWDVQCTFLTPQERCSVYAMRPLICRLYGVAEGLLCPHGCEPERVLTRAEAHALITETLRVGGGAAEPADATLPGIIARIREGLALLEPE